VTAQNSGSRADLEIAANLFEKIVDPANQPKFDDGRAKFDFTRDYVVLAELGKTLFKRSDLEPPHSDSERVFLLRAVAAYERALAVDPEHADSHYGLNQCYDRLGHSAATATAPSPVTVAKLTELGTAATKKDAPSAERVTAAAELAAGIEALSKLPPDPANPRLPALRGLILQLRPAFHAEQDAAVRSSLAAALASLHLISHTAYKADELARSSTTQKYRDANPAANAAAEAIVIYDTNRVVKP